MEMVTRTSVLPHAILDTTSEEHSPLCPFIFLFCERMLALCAYKRIRPRTMPPLPTIANSQALSDDELVLLTIANGEYFLPLMQRYEGRLLRYIRRITNVRAEEAEDLLQEVFIKAYRHLTSYDHRFPFSSWMYRMTRNHVISAARKRGSRPQTVSYDLHTTIIERIASEVDLAASYDRALLREDILAVLATMDEKYRAVFILRYFEDKSYEEISDILEKPMNTVATLLHRAKRHFRQPASRHPFIHSSPSSP